MLMNPVYLISVGMKRWGVPIWHKRVSVGDWMKRKSGVGAGFIEVVPRKIWWLVPFFAPGGPCQKLGPINPGKTLLRQNLLDLIRWNSVEGRDPLPIVARTPGYCQAWFTRRGNDKPFLTSSSGFRLNNSLPPYLWIPGRISRPLHDCNRLTMISSPFPAARRRGRPIFTPILQDPIDGGTGVRNALKHTSIESYCSGEKSWKDTRLRKWVMVLDRTFHSPYKRGNAPQSWQPK